MNDSSLLLKNKKKSTEKMNETYTRKKTKSIFSKKKSENEEMSLFDIKRLHI